jgi:hypothetical protein
MLQRLECVLPLSGFVNATEEQMPQSTSETNGTLGMNSTQAEMRTKLQSAPTPFEYLHETALMNSH